MLTRLAPIKHIVNPEYNLLFFSEKCVIPPAFFFFINPDVVKGTLNRGE